MLTAAHLARRFGDRLAVDDVSLTLDRGRVVALLGPNGAGKTTTLRMLAGLIEPSSGSVIVNGQPMTRHTAAHVRGHVGFLTEAPGLWDRLTVEQNLMVYARLHGVRQPARAVADTLALFEITDRSRTLAAHLSKGLKQRVALARTLLHQPDVVLLDEPTSGLDPHSAREVRELVCRLREQGRAVLLSTHNLDEVERVADTVAVLRTRMIAIDTPAALRARLFGARLRITLAHPAHPFVAGISGPGITGASADDSLLIVAVDDCAARAPGVVKHLVERGAEIRSVVPDQPSLEEVYLKLLEQQEVA